MSVPNDGKTAVEHASTAKKVMKQLKSELRDCEPDDLDSEDVVKLRRRFVHECEKAMEDSTFLSNMYELLWANAFYATVHVYRSAWKLNNGLRLKEKEDLIEFVKKTEKYLRNLQKTYPELNYQIFLNIGDLYRYCADITKSEEHLKTAIKYYGRALIVKPDEGHPFNQVGVMYRVQNPWKAAIMFLRGATALNPYKAAEDNFLLLKQTGFSNDWKELTWDYVYGMFEPFNRIVLDNFKTSWLNKLRSEFENDKPDIEKAYDSFGFVLLGSVLAIIDDQRSGNGERTRYLVHSLCEDYKYLVKEVGDIKRRSPTETRMKHRIKELKMRRRKKKTEEDSSDEEYKLFDSDNDDDEKDEEGDTKQEKDMILPLLAMIIDWFTMIDRVLKDKKISVAQRMDLQRLSQQILELINKYVDNLTDYVGKKTVTNVVWFLKYPGLQFTNDFYYELLPKLMESAENWIISPIYFDRYYKPLGKNQDLQTMREMARLRLEAAGDNETEKFELPKYVLFETDVIKSKLYVVKSIVKSKQIQILVGKAAIRKFDRLKSTDQDARSAVRYLEDCMKNNEIIVVNEDFNKPVLIAESFLKDLNDEDGILLILTIGNGKRQKIENKGGFKIFMEGVDKFLERFTAFQRKGAS